jgi:hypothetical protein
MLDKTTKEFRKGEEVEESIYGGVGVGGFGVVDIYAMPHVSTAKGLELVDCVFIVVGVDNAMADIVKDDLIGLLNDYPNPDRLAAGPSYMEVGAVLDSQDYALRLFALRQVLGLWKVITPGTMGVVEASIARQMAGSGFIMISGYKRR